MTATYSKQQIVLALKNSFIGDSKTLKETADYLQEASKLTGYCMILMEIVDEAQYSIEIKQAALIQLKNNIKLRWISKKHQLESNQKEAIKNALLLAVIRCAKNHKLIKLYKEIFSNIIGNQFKTWAPLPAILQKLQSNQDLVQILHILLAIAAAFEFSISEDERGYFFVFLKTVLPKLLELVQRHIQDSQILYLNIKFLWKAVHYEINQEIKLLTIGWMPLIQNIISLTNPAFTKEIEDFQLKDTPQFYYFHSKKWATRIFLRFIQKHTKKSSLTSKQNNTQFSEQWYSTFGGSFIQGLMMQFGIPTTKKVRFFQMKCLQALISQRPDEMKSFAEDFQYNILLKYMQLQPQDEEIAQRDPVEFISKEEQPSMNFTNLKRVATDAWVAFAQLGSRQEKRGLAYQSGVFFYSNMNYLQSKLEGQSMIEKELAMYLICQLRSTISKCKQVKSMLPTLISKYVIPEFKNEIMFLRARAVDIFYQYGTMEFDIDVIKISVEGIYLLLMNDPFPLVRIKAANAFNCILKHKIAKDLIKPLLKDVLSIYLQLLEKYDLQSLVNSLESIVQYFSTEISPFAYELTCYLAKLFQKLFNRDMQQSEKDQYDGEAELAAAGCLKTINQIIESPIDNQIVAKLQPEIIGLLQFIFNEQGVDFIQDSLIMLNTYLHKLEKITSHIWFYYQVVVYNVVGIPKQMWPALDKLPLNEKQKNILKSIKNGNNFEMMELSMPVLRNFIQKGSKLAIENHQAFKANLINLLFYLINQVYKKGPTEFSGQIQMTCCTALLIYLLQNFKKTLPQQIYQHIWQISKINIIKAKSKIIKILNSQLLSLLTWANPIKIISLINRDNFWTIYLRQIISYEQKFEQRYERVRSILGLNILLALPEKNNQLMSKIPDIFKTLIKMVKMNAEELIEEDGEEAIEQNNAEDNVDEADDMQGYKYQSDDDENFWEEQYGQNYEGTLNEINQIQQFKTMIQSLAQNQPTFYSELMKIVNQDDLTILAEKIKKAIQQSCEPQQL